MQDPSVAPPVLNDIKWWTGVGLVAVKQLQKEPSVGSRARFPMENTTQANKTVMPMTLQGLRLFPLNGFTRFKMSMGHNPPPYQPTNGPSTQLVTWLGETPKQQSHLMEAIYQWL